MRLEIAQKNLLQDEFSLQRIRSNDDEVLIEQIRDIGWTAELPATSIVDTSKFLAATAFSIKITNSTNQKTTIKATGNIVEYPWIAEPLIFHAMMYADVNTTVTAFIHPPNVSYTSVSSISQQITAGQWSPVFSNEYLFGGDNNAGSPVSVTVVIEQTTTEPIYFTLPTLTLAEPEKYNQMYILSQPHFPDIFRDVDLESVNPSRPFAKIFHSMSADFSQAMDKYVRMTNFERTEINHSSVETRDDPYNVLTRSELTDPSLMTPEYLEWGSMLRGSTILSDIKIADTSVFDPSFDFRRWQVTTAAYGHSAGSKASIKESVRNILSDKRLVLVTPLWNGNQFEIMIRTITSETPGNLVVGASSPAVLAVAENTRPAGYVFLHQTVDSVGFILNDPDFGVFDQNEID